MSDRIVESGVGFDEAFRRLRQGRVYSRDVPRGVVQGSYRSEAGEYFYTLDVPASYDPGRQYQVRVQLHGGVGRYEDNTPHGSGPAGRLSGAEQIYVMPYAWRDAPWWSGRQTENLHAILDLVKRAYNVDENRVVLSGVSDGGTGAYYTAMRDTTPFASFLPLNGFIMVLRNEMSEADGRSLSEQPAEQAAVHRERRPRSAVSHEPCRSLHRPAEEGRRRSRVPATSRARRTTRRGGLKSKTSFEAFVADHPRRPLPDTLTWESGPPAMPSRAHWLVIDRLAARRPDDPVLPDLNKKADGSRSRISEFGSSGTHINRVLNGIERRADRPRER